MTVPVPSFANDIAPILFKYRGQMAWRLDLASYDDVKANAQIIMLQIMYNPPGSPPGTPPSMPPPPFSPFPQSFIDQFQAWMQGGYPQ